MPELPEVETVVRGLQQSLPGRRILEVRLGKTDFIDDPAALERELPGSRVSGVRRHGKFILIDLQNSSASPRDFSLLVHLGMTGRLVTFTREFPVPPHTHVFLTLDNGRELRYTDIRRFGKMRLLRDGEGEGVLGHLGLDPLEATEKDFIVSLRNRRARIKALLLDQSVFRGIGNIYADESLWRAQIHPMRIAANLKFQEVRMLYRAVQHVLNEAIRLRGSSISDYVDSEGLPGGFHLKHRVYQREGQKCFRCKTPIRRTIVAGRSSHFCPRCQPPPRTRAIRKSRITLKSKNR